MKVSIALAVSLLLSSCGGKTVTAEATEPKDRFGLANIHQKRVDDVGNGYEKLYGTRNFRAVLSNLLYRGGANNKNNRDEPRPNRNPLPSIGLKSLCEQGFDTAVYMYPDGFETAPKKITCTNEITGLPSTLDYLQIGPYRSENVRELLEIVAKKIKSRNPASTYFHCWNGWHASGMISAFALRQFCDFSADQAVKYWDMNTDGNNTDPAFPKLREKIRAFIPYADLKLTADEQARHCLPLN